MAKASAAESSAAADGAESSESADEDSGSRRYLFRHDLSVDGAVGACASVRAYVCACDCVCVGACVCACCGGYMKLFLTRSFALHAAAICCPNEDYTYVFVCVFVCVRLDV